MPRGKNCSLVHDGIGGPCISCGKHDSSERYIHLINKKESAVEFYNFVKESYRYGDKDCICRKCEMKFIREKEKSITDEATPAKQKDHGPSTSAYFEKGLWYLNTKGNCSKDGDHFTSVNIDTVQACFEFRFDESQLHSGLEEVSLALCHQHYMKYSNYLSHLECHICEKPLRYRRSVRITEDRLQFLHTYMTSELGLHENKVDNPALCLPCYKAYNSFTNLVSTDLLKAKTDDYLRDCVTTFDIAEYEQNDIDMYSYQQVLHHVVNSFLIYKPLLLPQLFQQYLTAVNQRIECLNISMDDTELSKIQHNTTWLFNMLKSSLGPALLVYSSPKRKHGKMIYRLGTDLLLCLHSFLTNHEKEMESVKVSNIVLQKRINTLTADLESTKRNDQTLDNDVGILKDHAKCYVSEAIKSDLPDIHCFNLVEEIRKIHPELWNFIYRMTASEEEDKKMRKTNWKSAQHYIPHSENVQLFPRLYIASCIFHSLNSQCVQPLHLLTTDIQDKFSNSSTQLLTINSRIGAGISKDSLKRFITNRCTKIQMTSSFCSDSFAIASFDNLDKNQSYALVGSGRDKSGFHGTTIQAVISRPSEKHSVTETITNFTEDLEITKFEKSSQRMIPSELVKGIVDPDNRIGEPVDNEINKFRHLNLDDFMETGIEVEEWNKFASTLTSYNFVKHFLQEEHIITPGLKTYLASGNIKTEKSKFDSIAILNDPADSKETVFKTLNILHSQYKIGERLNYLVVVGDGKSYIHLIDLKNEYGTALDWVLPYPGDWHALKNILPIFIKIYYDAGLKELATKYHHGATLRVLTECTKFSITHRFFTHVLEAIFRFQIEAFIKSSDVTTLKTEFHQILEQTLECLPSDDQEILDSETWERVIAKKEEFEIILKDTHVDFEDWRIKNCSVSETFKFWDTFVHVDFMAYLGYYLSIRSRNWNLRNSALKKLTCLFHAFDRHNYLRMIPHHLADLMTFPGPILKHFQSGCFAASITGDNFYSVAIDEAHEMQINLKTKQVINSFTTPSLAALTYYLPYRAETLDNLKTQLLIQNSDSQRRETTKPHVETEELTIRDYIHSLHASSLFKVNEDTNVIPLQHIFNNSVATKEQSDCLLNYRKYGTMEMNNYISCFLLRVPVLGSKRPPRKRLSLKTFAAKKVTVPKQKREIKDNQTVIACLRKQIAFSKLTMKPVTDLNQFISLPRAISDASGLPMKGTKSNALKVMKAMYPSAFLSCVPPCTGQLSTVILEGMFMINSIPLSSQRSFGDYASFLFTRWVRRVFLQFSAVEVHVVFDHPNRHGVSPKDIERNRRDDILQEVSFDSVSSDTLLPSNWRGFLAVRAHKRKLVTFLCYEFLKLALITFPHQECLVITSGGFEGDHVDKAFGNFSGLDCGYVEFPLFSCNHEEGDTRVWFHALNTSSHRVIIYSPDTDTFFIGLPIMKHLTDKSIFIQLKDSVFDHQFIDMQVFNQSLAIDMSFQGVSCIDDLLQMVYIISGCDFVSYFHGIGKKTFFEVFRGQASFISDDPSDCNTDDIKGLCAFYRLILCVYFSKHKSAFQSDSVKQMYEDLDGNPIDRLLVLIHMFREKIWDRIVSEVELVPNAEALKLHWKRCCWVYSYWHKAGLGTMSLAEFQDYGWTLTDDALSIVWDSDDHLKDVKDRVEWCKKGCSCKSGCQTNRCSCRRNQSGISNGFCGPGCRCINCNNMCNADSEVQLQAHTVDQNDNSVETQDRNELDITTESESESEFELESDSECEPNFNSYWNTFENLVEDHFIELEESIEIQQSAT